MLRCVWIFNCCWLFHPVGQSDEWIYFLAWIGGSWSFTVMESLRMLGLSYSSMLIPASKRKSNKKKRTKRKKTERKKNQVHHHAPCKFVVLFNRLSLSVYLLTIDVAPHWSHRSMLKMLSGDRRLASRPTSTTLVPCRTVKSIAQLSRECQREHRQHVQSSA